MFFHQPKVVVEKRENTNTKHKTQTQTQTQKYKHKHKSSAWIKEVAGKVGKIRVCRGWQAGRQAIFPLLL